MAVRHDPCVTVYLETSPVTDGEPERIAMKNATAEAVAELNARGASRADVDDIREHLEELVADTNLWLHAARSLAVFATPGSVRTFRLPNRLTTSVHTSDRFFVKPLMRAVTFPHSGYVLALSQHDARLLEVLAEGVSFTATVPNLPRGVDHATASSGAPGRAPRKEITSTEGDKVRMGQYARRVDEALRPVLDGSSPLILAATEPLASIFAAGCTYPLLADEVIAGNPDHTPDGDLSDAARVILDHAYARQVADAHDRFGERAGQERSVTDLADVARAATLGMVDTLFVDIDDTVWGQIDASTGHVTFTTEDDPDAHAIVDEVIRRVWDAGGTVMAVRAEEVPGGGTAAATLRYPMV